MLNGQSAEAKTHPAIMEFVNLIDETTDHGVLDFIDLKTRPFMQFWNRFIIYRYEDVLNDFRVILYGTNVASLYGADWTGKLLSEMGFADAYDKIHEWNMKIINGEKRLYASGTLFWQNREHKNWHQVKIPLQRNGKINEVLIYMDFL